MWRRDKTKTKDLGLIGVVKCRKVSRWEKLTEIRAILVSATLPPDAFSGL